MSGGEAPKLAFESNLLEEDLARIAADRPIAHLNTKPIDDLIDGVRPRLYIICAEPGAGKTTLLLQIADELGLNGVKVLFFTMEMDRKYLLEKSFSRLSRGTVRVNEVASATVTGEEHIRRTVEEYRIGIAKNIAFSCEHVSASEISAIVKRVKKNPEDQTELAVFIDYLQIMSPENERQRGDAIATLKGIVAKLREIVTEHSVPIFAVSSINRPSYRKEAVELSSIAESSSIEYSADSVLALTVEGDKKSRDNNLALPVRPVTLALLKNRYGACGKVKLDFDPSFATFRRSSR